jgi:CRISPR system Cascade subunit CasE
MAETTYSALWSIDRRECRRMGMVDAYSLHKHVFDLFEDIRSESQKKQSVSSGILYADKGERNHTRQIVILANRKPKTSTWGRLKIIPVDEGFWAFQRYGFEVMMNPTKREKESGKTVPITGREPLRNWFIDKASRQWGFEVEENSLEITHIGVNQFQKKGKTVTHNKATFTGRLTVSERDIFIESVKHGIGRAKGFGFGLLQIVPLT